MSGNCNVSAEMRFQSIHAADMIRMMMREDNLAHLSSRGSHLVNTFRQRLLLVFVRRSGIDDQQLFGSMDQVTAGVRCRRRVGVRTGKQM